MERNVRVFTIFVRNYLDMERKQFFPKQTKLLGIKMECFARVSRIFLDLSRYAKN